ncbi:hypothetical protein N0V85_001697 [Neurospora sp. IMI 360204]|nr:hypothetical protein N0V85_001697 [Neurospora sp. IMI 360204]
MGFMPGLTITTSVPPDAGTTTSPRTGDVGAPDAEEAPQNAPSPIRPPVSPITPTQESARLSGPGGHGDDQIGIPPPPPQPIAFDDNPDVLALKSAITILQLQRQRATADIQALNRAKVAALSDPGAFVADLAAGRIGMDGDPLVNGPGADGSNDDDEDDEDGDEDQDQDEDMKSEEDGDDGEDDDEEDEAEAASSSSESRHDDQDGDIPMSGAGAGAGSSPSTPNSNNNNNNNSHNRRKIPTRKKDRVSKTTKQPPQDLSKTWRTLPKPQTVVRCPPINWAQYAVVGESLDKLHREQITAPTLGVPAVLSPGGVYEFRGTATAAGTAGGGGSIGGGSGSGGGYAVGDATMGSTDRTSTPPTGTEGYINAIGQQQQQQQQQIPGETGQGQGLGSGPGPGPQIPSSLPTLGRHQQPQRLVGVAAPYTPGRDKIERTTGRKGAKR